MIDRAQREKQLFEMTQMPLGQTEIRRLYRVVRATKEAPMPTVKDITISQMITSVLEYEYPPSALEK